MRRYDLELPVAMRVLPFLVLTVFTVVFPAILATEQGIPRLLAIPALAFFAWQWWIFLSLAYRVLIHEDGTTEWIALTRRVSVRPEAVQEIGPDRSGSIGFFRMVHSAGKVRFVNQITGFHELVAHIKSHNPSVVLKGC